MQLETSPVSEEEEMIDEMTQIKQFHRKRRRAAAMTNSGHEQPQRQQLPTEARRGGRQIVLLPWTRRCLVSVLLLLFGSPSTTSSTSSSPSGSSSSLSADETLHSRRQLSSAAAIVENSDISNDKGHQQPRMTEIVVLPRDFVDDESSSTLGLDKNPLNTSTLEDALIFAVVPKVIDNEFFLPVKQGCEDQARLLSEELDRLVVCNFTGPTTTTMGDTAEERGVRQMQIVMELLNNPQVAGISISIQNDEIMKEVLEVAREDYPNKPIITFDSDIATPHLSLRQAYIGTNQTFFGAELARAMLHLHPTVGTYAVIYSEDAPNMHERLRGFEYELHMRQPGWKQVVDPVNVQDNLTKAIEVLDRLATDHHNITSIVSVMGLPMRATTSGGHRPWKDLYERHMNKGIQFLCGDSMRHQLEFLSHGYVQGLIGQMPYEFGTKSIQTLFELVVNNHGTTTTTGAPDEKDQKHRYTQVVTTVTDNDDVGVNNNNSTSTSTSTTKNNNNFMGTNVLSHIFVPLEIPEYDIDTNLIGNLRYVGYTLFAIMALTGLQLLHWTYNYRNVRVVQVAQPKFLAMVIVGVLIMSCCLVPLGMDDGGDSNNLTDAQAVAICMSPSWLASLGFTTTFSALYAKTRRINKVFHSNSAFARVKVSESEVLRPFTILTFCNVVVLTAWTILDPLRYERTAVLGADGWQRVLESYGGCTSNNLHWFLIPLVCLNCGVLLLANWQAFEARHIEAEFSETKYIGIIMASMLQAAVSGIPVLFVVQGNPDASYLVLVFLIFIIGMGILLVLFVPKISFARLFMSRTEVEQRDFISFIIQKSSRQQGRKWGGGGGPNDHHHHHGPGGGAPLHQSGFAPREAAAFESRWASVTPTTQLTYVPSSQGSPSTMGPSTQIDSVTSGGTSINTSQIPSDRSGGEPIGQDTVGTGRLLYSPNSITSFTPEERISNMSSISGGTAKLIGSNSSSGVNNIHSASTGTEGRTTFLLGHSTGGNRSYATSKSSGHSTGTPSISYHGDSVHSFYSATPTHSQPSTPMQSQRNVFDASSHSAYPHPDLQNDDPQLGMLVFRTMSVRADGSLAPSSLHQNSMHHHTMHSRHTHNLPTQFEPEDEEDESFSTGTTFSFFSAVGRSARNLFGGPETATTTRAPSLRNLASPPMTRNNPSSLRNLAAPPMLVRNTSQGRTLPSSNSARFRGAGGLLGIGRVGSSRLSETMPSMRAIAERTGGDESESSVSTSTMERSMDGGHEAKASPNHDSSNSIPPELNSIQEHDDASDGDESGERAAEDDSTNSSSSAEDEEEGEGKAKGGSNHTLDHNSTGSDLNAIQEIDPVSYHDEIANSSSSVEDVVNAKGGSNHTLDHKDDEIANSSSSAADEDKSKAKGGSNDTLDHNSIGSDLNAIQETNPLSYDDEIFDGNESISSSYEPTAESDGEAEGSSTSTCSSEHTSPVQPELQEIGETSHESDGDEDQAEGDAAWTGYNNHLRGLLDITAQNSDYSISFE